jgi:hypothetical protein
MNDFGACAAEAVYKYSMRVIHVCVCVCVCTVVGRRNFNILIRGRYTGEDGSRNTERERERAVRKIKTMNSTAVRVSSSSETEQKRRESIITKWIRRSSRP